MAVELQSRPAAAVPAPAPAPRPRPSPLPWLGPLLLVALAALPYLPELSSYFLGDDFGLIWLFHQKRIGHFITLFWYPWTEDVYGIFADELRPTVAFSYWLDGRLFGAHDPFGFHLDNTLLHVACTLLVWGVARTIVRRESVALTAGALFAVTPIHPEAVTWISGRADLIPTFFYVAAFLLFVLYRQGRGWWALALAAGASVLALYSKQSGVTLLGMLVAYDLVFGRLLPGTLRVRAPGRLWVRLLGSLAAYLPFLAALLGYLALRRVLFGSTLREELLAPERVAEFFGRQPFYLAGAFLGGRLDHLFGGDVSIAEWVTLLIVGGAAVAGLVTLMRRGTPETWRQVIFFGPVWYAICVLPLLMTYQSPRHLYQATVGSSIALALLIWLPFWERSTAVPADGGLSARSRGEAPTAPAVARRALLPALAAVALVAAFAFRLVNANLEWHDAGRASERGVTQLAEIAEALPARSKVVLLAPGAYGPAWLYEWSLPYIARAPFGRVDIYALQDVVEAPDVYCCPLDHWWPRRQPMLSRWLSEAPEIEINTVAWDGPSASFGVEARRASAADLRRRIEALLGRPLESATEVSEDQASGIVRILYGG